MPDTVPPEPAGRAGTAGHDSGLLAREARGSQGRPRLLASHATLPPCQPQKPEPDWDRERSPRLGHGLHEEEEKAWRWTVAAFGPREELEQVPGWEPRPRLPPDILRGVERTSVSQQQPDTSSVPATWASVVPLVHLTVPIFESYSCPGCHRSPFSSCPTFRAQAQKAPFPLTSERKMFFPPPSPYSHTACGFAV